MPIVVEASIGDDGQLSCYLPLSGWDEYWKAAGSEFCTGNGKMSGR
jgi:hypothetical protein